MCALLKKIVFTGMTVLFSLTFFSCSSAQHMEKKDWCPTRCDLAGDEKKNTEDIYGKRDTSTDMSMTEKNFLLFPLRIAIVENNQDHFDELRSKIRTTIDILNSGFLDAKIHFDIEQIDFISSPLRIEDLSANHYETYNTFSQEHDRPKMMSLYIFDYDPELCSSDDNVVRCGRTGGFSYILSRRTNNIVLSKFDLEDQKIITHEFGHFFGLYHTFEEHQFGKDHFSADQCSLQGDRICDTPPDPGTLYEVYVNYSTCEMVNLKFDDQYDYKPLINNYMSYYKPCYLKEYSFTPQQIEVIRMAAESDIRIEFSR